jgi:hypothetical protein
MIQMLSKNSISSQEAAYLNSSLQFLVATQDNPEVFDEYFSYFLDISYSEVTLDEGAEELYSYLADLVIGCLLITKTTGKEYKPYLIEQTKTLITRFTSYLDNSNYHDSYARTLAAPRQEIWLKNARIVGLDEETINSFLFYLA